MPVSLGLNGAVMGNEGTQDDATDLQSDGRVFADAREVRAALRAGTINLDSALELQSTLRARTSRLRRAVAFAIQLIMALAIGASLFLAFAVR